MSQYDDPQYYEIPSFMQFRFFLHYYQLYMDRAEVFICWLLLYGMFGFSREHCGIIAFSLTSMDIFTTRTLTRAFGAGVWWCTFFVLNYWFEYRL